MLMNGHFASMFAGEFVKSIASLQWFETLEYAFAVDEDVIGRVVTGAWKVPSASSASQTHGGCRRRCVVVVYVVNFMTSQSGERMETNVKGV